MSLPQEPLVAWLNSTRGTQFVALEREQIGRRLPGLIGYRLLQIGRWGLDDTLYENSPMLQHWVVGVGRENDVHLRCDGRTLPIASRSVDAVLMPHSLERVTSPHRLLREVDRVLCAHGQVVVSGFNPWGLWAAGQRLPWGKPHYPSTSRFYTLNRVRDWLELLDFEITEARSFGLNFPRLQSAAGAGSASQLLAPFSQAYQLLARKRVIPLTPQRPRWQRVPVTAPNALPEARVHRVR
ncbi:MAG: class I SAM-dependent methyltransferase [Nevskiales bacterium]